MTRLTDEKLRALNVTWQKMEPDTTIAAAFAELVERREADLTSAEIDALVLLRRWLGDPIMNWEGERLALVAIDKVTGSGGSTRDRQSIDLLKLKAALTSARGFLRGVSRRSELGAGAKDLLEAADDIDRVLAEVP